MIRHPGRMLTSQKKELFGVCSLYTPITFLGSHKVLPLSMVKTLSEICSEHTLSPTFGAKSSRPLPLTHLVGWFRKILGKGVPVCSSETMFCKAMSCSDVLRLATPKYFCEVRYNLPHERFVPITEIDDDRFGHLLFRNHQLTACVSGTISVQANCRWFQESRPDLL